MALPNEIRAFCEKQLGAISSTKPVSGGCINNGAQINTITGTYFIKWNSATRFPHMFSKERNGLQELEQAKALRIPRVINVYEGEQHSCLVQEWIESGPPGTTFWKQFGDGLANLHRKTNDTFGLDENNYMGSLTQDNTPSNSWIEFFIHYRILPQATLALDTGKLTSSEYDLIVQLTGIFSDLLHNEKPALTHGDLWSGNFMIDDNGKPVLIDPAVAYCHRETDLALTQLFGGYDAKFYDAYQSSFPMAPGWQERLDIYNLYPLLIHVNLFGGGYSRQVMQTVNRFV